jgi:glycogen debranching enzyme
MGMLDAARSSEHRLPEAYSGYDRSFGRQPVPFPLACSPQAWASGAGMLFVRTMLGLDVKNGRIVLDPRIPAKIGRIMLAGRNAFGRRWDIEATMTQSYVRLGT